MALSFLQFALKSEAGTQMDAEKARNADYADKAN
jgi:hypothetical protein